MSSTPSDSVSTTLPLGTPQSHSVMDSSDCEDKLLAALESGDFQTALQLLPRDSPSPPTVGPDNLTPLHYVCQHGQADIALLLITEYNYSINSRSRAGQTPLHFAANYGHLEVMRLLVKQSHRTQHSEHTGASSNKAIDANSVSPSSLLNDEQSTSKQQLQQHELPFLSAADIDGNTPLHLAATHGHLHLTKYLIHDAHCNPASTNNEKQTPLCLAAMHGHLEVVQYLVEKEGCDPSANDEYGRTPLYLAAGSGQLEVVKYLITEKQCDPNCKTTKCKKETERFREIIRHKFASGRTPLHAASQGGHLEVVQYLIEELSCSPSCTDNDGRTPLYVASCDGQITVVKLLTEEKHCNPLCKTNSGETPLHGAALGGSLEVVKFLISEKGCDPMCRGRWGRIPLHHASQEGHLEIAKYLIDEQHVDPSCIDVEHKVTSLANASIMGHLAIVKFLTDEKKCDLLHKDKLGYTPLHRAVLGGSLKVVKFFISEKGCDPMCRGRWGRTPLHCASQNGHLEIVKYLVVEQHVNPSCLDENNHTPLRLASQLGHMTLVKFLIEEKQCDPLYKDKYGDTPLHGAAFGGSLEVVKFFISEKGCDPMCRGQLGRTLLHHASHEGHLEIVKYLINEQHVNPSCLDENNRTPLRLASQLGHMTLVKFFIEEKHCDPLHKDKYGDTSLHGAALGGSLEVVKFFISEKGCDPMCRGQCGRTPLHYASYEGHLETVKCLVDEQHVNPSCLDEANHTPLRLASQLGHMTLVKFLAEEKQCDPLYKDKCGDTSLHGAAQGGSLEVVKFFISEKGCDPMCRGQLGRTPLHYASYGGHLEIVKYLVDEQHVNPSCLDENNHTPLRLASQFGHMTLVKFLAEEKQCDPLYKHKYGDTSLHGAALGGSLEVVKFFISEKGCDPMCRGQWGRTPLHCASYEGYLEIVKYLVDEQQAEPSCPDNNNVTPLHTASVGGHMDVVKYLVDHKHCDPSVKTKYMFDGDLQISGYPVTASAMTPVDFAVERNHTDVVQYLISKGGTPRIYVLQKGVAISPLVKVHVVGNSGSGKSSLVKALQDEDSPVAGRLFKVSGVIPKTSGIIPVEFQSKKFGRVTLYDFAGHEEYYAGHEAIFQNTSLSIVLLTVNLSDSSDKIRKMIGYWESLVGNAVSTSAHVIVIGSHSDELSARDMQMKSAILSEVIDSPSIFKGIRHAGWVTLDCRKSSSAGISILRRYLKRICKSVRIEANFDYKNAAILNAVLNKQLINMKACTFTELLTGILESWDPNLEQLKSPHFLFQTCESLNKSGHILFLKNKERPEESWLVLNKEAILSDVHGLLKQVQLSSTSGIVSQSQLMAILKNARVGLHIDLVRHYLVQMEFCIEIESHLLELIGGSELPHTKENCFLFPDLLSGNRPSDVWQPNSQFTYYFGWGLKCTEPSNFFTPRFLQVLLIHLASRFALNPHPKSPGLLELAQGCRLWKNGIHWRDGWGIEAIVEISDQNTVLNVIMRCFQGSEMKLIQMRSSVIQQVLNAKGHVCPTISPKEYLIHPSCLQCYPMEQVVELPVKHIMEAIKNEHPYLQLDEHGSPDYMSIRELLYFEPYQDFSVELLQQLFDTQHGDKGIPHGTLCEVATALQSRWKIFSKLCEQYVSRGEIAKVEMDSTMNEAQKCLHILTIWSGKDGTYGSLRQFLDQYSIFAGRNPLTLEAPSPAPEDPSDDDGVAAAALL